VIETVAGMMGPHTTLEKIRQKFERDGEERPSYIVEIGPGTGRVDNQYRPLPE